MVTITKIDSNKGNSNDEDRNCILPIHNSHITTLRKQLLRASLPAVISTRRFDEERPCLRAADTIPNPEVPDDLYVGAVDVATDEDGNDTAVMVLHQQIVRQTMTCRRLRIVTTMRRMRSGGVFEATRVAEATLITIIEDRVVEDDLSRIMDNIINKRCVEDQCRLGATMVAFNECVNCKKRQQLHPCIPIRWTLKNSRE
jgi:hypothetical protein